MKQSKSSTQLFTYFTFSEKPVNITKLSSCIFVYVPRRGIDWAHL